MSLDSLCNHRHPLSSRRR